MLVIQQSSKEDWPLLLYRQYYLLFLPMFCKSMESPHEMGRKKLMSRKGTALKTLLLNVKPKVYSPAIEEI